MYAESPYSILSFLESKNKRLIIEQKALISPTLYNMVEAARGIVVPVPFRDYSLIERDSS